MSGLRQGLLHLPGSTYETKTTLERLLAEDLEKHHCFYTPIRFHNHLNHHLLAAYDMGAPATLLQKIYDQESPSLSPINLIDREKNITGALDLTITRDNWAKHLGPEKNYIGFFAFFKGEIEEKGVPSVLEEYLFTEKANAHGADMLLRLVGGAVHPFIDLGYGVEFNQPMIVASALAQTCITAPMPSEFYDNSPTQSPPSPAGNTTLPKGARNPTHGGLPLLQILKLAYDSDIMKPPMPYNPSLNISQRRHISMVSGRPEEIARLSALWGVSASSLTDKECDERAEEFIWLAVLLLAGTGKEGRKPRLDFFLMHLVTSSIFVPSLLKALPSTDAKAQLLRILPALALYWLTIRGRPRINPRLLMSYSAYPHPPSVLGDPREPGQTNPWPAIVASVMHAPEAHVLKAVRTLYYAAGMYGETPAGGVVGAFALIDGKEGKEVKETHAGMAEVDGTIFVRAAGVVMDTLGWVTHGQKEGKWDRSALGWEDAWKDGN
ncbi:hypothetical protein BD410DRAFT_733140 [Rickenella mellea]|uniref:Uncharacterized protein n=1 Tax=Rickenella mellea TaxID=50990 RepID=A0A4Y7PKN8_9AGAM|nr:hypothetical protein BD410DRAFT_733140 [Rickenella mellea]